MSALPTEQSQSQHDRTESSAVKVTWPGGTYEKVFDRAFIFGASARRAPVVQRRARPVDAGDLHGGRRPRRDRRRHSVEDAQALQDLVERNHEAMELLSESPARQRLQFPPIEVGSELDDDSEFVLRLSELARLPLIRAKLFAARDDAAAAGHELLTALRVGEMICQGEGQVLHYLIGLWIRSAALTGMQRMAERFPDATDMRRQFAAAVEEEMRTPEGLPVSIRADFCCISLPQLARARKIAICRGWWRDC